MLQRHALTLLLPLLIGSGGACAAPKAPGMVNPWHEVPGPAAGEPRVIGNYTGGCLQGAVSLKEREGDYALMRQSRRRYYTHPDMARFVERLAAEVRARGYGRLLVGDLSQARGGPTTTGHASHQTGLDGDFWFWLDSPATDRALSPTEVEDLSALSMLNEAQTGVDLARFGERQARLLEFVAAQPDVERVFVHPAIKKALCERTGQAAWLNRVRPWWGHHYHFHVRLGCPPGQDECKVQEPVPQGPGCDAELDWWFSAEAAEKARKGAAEAEKLSPEQRLAAKLAKVPAACGALLP